MADEDRPVTRREMDQLRDFLAGMRADLGSRLDAHVLLHDQERTERITARRWRIGAIFAAMAALAGLFGLLIQILIRVGH